MVYSADGGVTWDEEPPLDVVEEDEDLAEFIEGGAEFYYPQLAKKVDHKAHIILHADGEPGIYVNFLNGNVTDDTQGLTPTLIWYLGQNNILSSTSESLDARENLSLFPNPANEEILLKLDSDNNQVMQLKILNSLGMILKSERIELSANSYYPIAIQNLSPGMYHLLVRMENGNTKTLEFIKQ
jgi:hypothetical protein